MDKQDIRNKIDQIDSELEMLVFKYDMDLESILENDLLDEEEYLYYTELSTERENLIQYIIFDKEMI